MKSVYAFLWKNTFRSVSNRQLQSEYTLPTTYLIFMPDVYLYSFINSNEQITVELHSKRNIIVNFRSSSSLYFYFSQLFPSEYDINQSIKLNITNCNSSRFTANINSKKIHCINLKMWLHLISSVY